MHPGASSFPRAVEATLLVLGLLLSSFVGACSCGSTGGSSGLEATLEATSPVVADGVRASVVQITVSDASGEPAAGISVVLESDRAADQIEQPASPTGAAGQATARVSSTEVGTSTLSLTTAEGEAIAGSGTVEFIAATECNPGESESCYEGPSGTEGVGPCQAGQRDCDTTGTWGACGNQVLPLSADDDCDGVDSDCDGSTDEDVDPSSPATCGGCGGVVCSFPNAGAICDPVTASCSRGACDPDWWPATDPANGCDTFCTGDPSADELCNGEDDDCDGSIDEGFDADVDGFTTCGTGVGGGLDPSRIDCDDLVAEVYPGGTETCDGRDEDCDGTPDNGLTAPGLCLALGVCAGTSETCSGAGGWVCTYAATYQVDEDAAACEGLDNDCDGLTDENCSCTDNDTQPCSTDTGECTVGIQTCVGGVWGACSGVMPTTETCDGTDQNCDGQFDEGFDGDSDGYSDCGTVPGGGVDPARVDCDPAVPSVYPGAPELCNGIDDSCDGTTDEGMDADCDDQVFCNGAETCGGASGCQAGTPPSCDDGFACTSDTCDPTADACQSTADDGLCDDGNACTTDFCDLASGCQASNDSGTSCSVGACTGSCGGGVCVGCTCSTPADCDDGVGCTVDDCVGAACTHLASDAACDDSVFCNGVETCDLGADCQPGTAPTCDDGVGCTVDTCDAGTDGCLFSPDDAACQDGVFCNGAETCDAVADCQAGSPPSCDDGLACTADSCDAGLDQCVHPGASIDPASTVTASSSCLTLDSGASAAIFVDLRDTLGLPFSGATLTPQVSGAAVSWSTAFTESTALPGTYYGVLVAPASGGSSTVSIDYSGCAQTGSLGGSVTITYGAANSGVGGTGGCAGPDGNLRVRVLAAEDDSPLASAHVMVGLAAGTPLVTDPEVFLAGGTSNVSNTAVTDAQGWVTFADLGSALDGPVTITAGQADASTVERAYFTFAGVSAADLVMPLAEADPARPTVRLDTGTATGFSATGSINDLQGGLVLPQVTLSEVTSLNLDSLLEPNRCVTLPAGQGVLAMPENLWVPRQCMQDWFLGCLVYLAEDEWAATVPQNNRLNMVVGGLPSSVAQNMCEWSELLQAFDLSSGSNSALGFVPSTGTASDASGTSVALSTGAHRRTLALTTANRPAFTDVFAAVLGDHAGSTGLGPNYVNGFKFERYDASPGSTSVLYAATAAGANLPTAPDPAAARYWAAAIATYFDPAPSRPAGSAPPVSAENGASTVLWREDSAGLAPLDGSADATWSVDDFLDIAKVGLDASNKTFTWDDVATARIPDLSVHQLYRETETYRAAALSCASEKDVISTEKANYWEVWRPYGVTCTGLTGNETTPGPKECFTLPTLPASWPRAGANPTAGKFDGLPALVGGAEACTVVGDCGIGTDACEAFGGRCTVQTHKSCNGNGDCSGCLTGDTCGGAEQICVDTSTGLSRTQQARWSLRVDTLGSNAAFDFNAFDLPERSATLTHESSNHFPLNR